MKITDIEVIKWNPGTGKNFIYVKLSTDAGITGWGEAYSQSDRDTQIENQQKLDALIDPKQIVKHEHDFLRLVCKNWSGVVDDTKSPVSFTDQAFRDALQKAWFREAVYAAYNESLSGKDARLGN